MNIHEINPSQFTNGLHNQLAAEIKNLYAKHNPQAFNIVPQFDIFCVELDKEDECFKIVRKDNYSVLKEEVDFERDSILLGMTDAIKSALRHYKPEVKEAARRLKILVDEYNRPVPMVRQPYDAETASIRSLLQDLNKKYAVDMELTGIVEWAQELAAKNNAFEQLVNASNEQKAQKSDMRMLEARKNVDRAWKNILILIQADIIRDGDEKYKDFVAEWNALVKHYSDIWAQHQGRNKAKKEKNTDEQIDELKTETEN